MSGQMNKWKEEQVLIICPGSQTTMAQLGCNELTPPAFRIPTRMFRDEETGEWRPNHTWKRKKVQKLGSGATRTIHDNTVADDVATEDEYEYVEDPESNEGAVYPLQGKKRGASLKGPSQFVILSSGILIAKTLVYSRPHCQHGRIFGVSRARPWPADHHLP